MSAVWGYARVSRENQALALQLDALEAAGVPLANIVQEKASGARQRPAFDALLKKLQPGDKATTRDTAAMHTKLFRSTPPCRGRPARLAGHVQHADVSIHAPVQGATWRGDVLRLSTVVSIHGTCQRL